MAASPSISILTLYDTPLSLKPNYRHHLVNSLWSLKSLDYYVISDEEIIEDSSFGGCFAPLQPMFYINVSCSLAKASIMHSEYSCCFSCNLKSEPLLSLSRADYQLEVVQRFSLIFQITDFNNSSLKKSGADLEGQLV